MSLINLRNKIGEIFKNTLREIPADMWRIHVEGNDEINAFGENVQISLHTKISDEQNDEDRYEYVIQLIIDLVDMTDYLFNVDQASICYRCICDDEIIEAYEATLFDLSTVKNILKINPDFIEYQAERRKAKSMIAYDYIAEKITDPTAEWLIAYHEEDKLSFGINVKPDYYIFGLLHELDEERDIIGIRKGSLIEIGLHPIDKSYYDADSIDCIRDLILNDIREGLAPASYYKTEIPNWVGEMDFDSEIEEDGVYDIGIKDFVIRTTGYWCIQHKHTLERIKAIIKVLNEYGEIMHLEAEAMYCRECDEYYITESEYERIRSFGTLCHKVITEKEYIKAKGNYKAWAEKSTLRSYGYSVSEQENLPEDLRQGILMFVILYGVMSIDEALSFLEWLVRNRGHKYHNAKEKWLRDIAFVRENKTIKAVVEAGNFYRIERVK